MDERITIRFKPQIRLIMHNKVLQIHEILSALVAKHEIFETHLKCKMIDYSHFLGLSF